MYPSLPSDVSVLGIIIIIIIHNVEMGGTYVPPAEKSEDAGSQAGERQGSKASGVSISPTGPEYSDVVGV